MAGMLPTQRPQQSQDDLYYYRRLRDSLPANSPLHAIYGPLEHGQFAEEVVSDNPLMALPVAAATPLYTAGKATGMIQGTRSPASMEEMMEAYRGIGRGLKRRFGMMPQQVMDFLIPSAAAAEQQPQPATSRPGMLTPAGRKTRLEEEMDAIEASLPRRKPAPKK